METKNEQPKEKQVPLDTIVSGTDNEAEIELAEIADMRGLVTNFHLNDDFLRWWTNNFNDVDLNTACKRLTYYANKLVKKGFLKPCERVGTGEGGYSSFGVTTQSIWRREYH